MTIGLVHFSPNLLGSRTIQRGNAASFMGTLPQLITMKLLLCLLPVFVQARIIIDIHASETMRESDIAVKGSLQKVITPTDITSFQLTESVLKNGVYKLTDTQKRVPTNVYIKSPTPWHDLYKTYGWKQVNTVIKPVKTNIVYIEKETDVVLNRKIVHGGSEPSEHKVTLPTKVENNVTSYWNKDTKPFKADIEYNINFDGIGNLTKFNLNSTWNTNLFKRDVGVVSPSVVQFSLEPNQNSSVTLTATKVTVNVQVEHMAILDGIVVANFEEAINGHHFYAYDIGSVMDAANLSDIITTKEDIVIQFYADSKVIVEDII
ncbi:hypothetical protein MSG28_015576 [Choristoneura fumiferana]|uniref:Uncharacterized protein n=1 Tax=Choristoneura fumiferana TaxID=7141 RepID=A0ACC0KBH1_CHOFU|nr:hypothetical protein MSG28_015576 [Choristoneura fumiferana]